MPKTNINTFATISEIIASLAVVVSLVFVVLSLNQNTAALQSINDNLLYELQDSRLNNVTSVPGFAEILVKYRTGEILSTAESLQIDYWVIRELNMWELAYSRHREGFMPPAAWAAWEKSFVNGILPYLPETKWNEWKDTYGTEFGKYLETVQPGR